MVPHDLPAKRRPPPRSVKTAARASPGRREGRRP